MSARTNLFEAAYAAMDRAVAAHGSERQVLIEEAMRLFHAAQAIEAQPAQPLERPVARDRPRRRKRRRERRSFGEPPSTH